MVITSLLLSNCWVFECSLQSLMMPNLKKIKLSSLEGVKRNACWFFFLPLKKVLLAKCKASHDKSWKIQSLSYFIPISFHSSIRTRFIWWQFPYNNWRLEPQFWNPLILNKILHKLEAIISRPGKNWIVQWYYLASVLWPFETVKIRGGWGIKLWDLDLENKSRLISFKVVQLGYNIF